MNIIFLIFLLFFIFLILESFWKERNDLEDVEQYNIIKQEFDKCSFKKVEGLSGKFYLNLNNSKHDILLQEILK